MKLRHSLMAHDCPNLNFFRMFDSKTGWNVFLISGPHMIILSIWCEHLRNMPGLEHGSILFSDSQAALSSE